MSNIKIVALVTVKPEHTETLKPLFQSLVKASRAEEGNISYDLHQEIGKPERFVFVENWKSQAAIDAHNASAVLALMIFCPSGLIGLFQRAAERRRGQRARRFHR